MYSRCSIEYELIGVSTLWSKGIYGVDVASSRWSMQAALASGDADKGSEPPVTNLIIPFKFHGTRDAYTVDR